jgi:hypothetical protein
VGSKVLDAGLAPALLADRLPWRRPRRSRRRTYRAADASAYARTVVGPAGTRVDVLEPAGNPSGGSHTASASESVSAANTRSGEALMTRTAVSVRLIAGAPVALVDHARAERPGLDQV